MLPAKNEMSDAPETRRSPEYDLLGAQYACKFRLRISIQAARSCTAMEMDEEEDIFNCFKGIKPAEFDHAVMSEKWPGVWLDVYKVSYLGRVLYVKFKLDQVDAGDSVHLLSFKEWGS